MSIDNGYVSLLSFKAGITASDQQLSTDLNDDAFIEDLIERASREFDGMCGRSFYPRVETQYYDVPDDEVLWFDDDLLEVITLTNGSATAVATSDYHFKPRRGYPKFALYLTDITDVSWECTTTDSYQEAIQLNGIWGYRENYDTEAWITGSTLSASLDSASTTFSVASDDLIPVDSIIKVDNELMIVTTSSSNEITVIQRGDNGSTAAGHESGATVYVWQHPADISQFVLEMAHIKYKSRFGPNAEVLGTSYMTPGGVVTNPRALPLNAKQMIDHYKRRV